MIILIVYKVVMSFLKRFFEIKPRSGLSVELIIWCMIKELYPTIADSIKHDVREYGDKLEEGYDQLDVTIDTITLCLCSSQLIFEPNENIVEDTAEKKTQKCLYKICEKEMANLQQATINDTNILRDMVENDFQKLYDETYQKMEKECRKMLIEKSITSQSYIEEFIIPYLEQKERHIIEVPIYTMYKDHKIPISKVILEFHPHDIHIDHTVNIDTKERQAVWKDKNGNIIQHLNKKLFLKYKDEIEKKINK